MAANQRFSTGIEVLVLMATEPEKFHTSQTLATVLATNPVVVRRLLAAFSHAGLVTSSKGPSGGSYLAHSPKRITLRDVYRALGGGNLLHRGKHESAETQNLKRAVQNIFRKAEKRLEDELDSTTLNQVIKRSGKKAAKPKCNPAAVQNTIASQAKEEETTSAHTG